jgi:hypothetical protein
MRSTISKFAVTAGVAAAALALTGAPASASAGGHAAEPDVIRLVAGASGKCLVTRSGNPGSKVRVLPCGDLPSGAIGKWIVTGAGADGRDDIQLKPNGGANECIYTTRTHETSQRFVLGACNNSNRTILHILAGGSSWVVLGDNYQSSGSGDGVLSWRVRKDGMSHGRVITRPLKVVPDETWGVTS